MRIALDYDNTYTAAPDLFCHLIRRARELGHTIDIVTMRNEETEAIPKLTAFLVDNVFYTNRQAKASYMRKQNIKIDIWIDDRPEFILNGADNG